MRVIALVTLVSALVCACAGSGHSKGTAMNHGDAQGLWQQAREVAAPGTEGTSMPDTYTFKYEHDLVTIRLMVLSPSATDSPDGVYALRSRWQGDTLQYQAPHGQWTDLAVFEHGHFTISGDGQRRELERIEPGQIADFNADLLKPRAAFEYK